MAKRFVAVGFVVAGTLLVVGTYGAVVSADHTWGNPAYHWARKTPSFQPARRQQHDQRLGSVCETGNRRLVHIH